MQPIFHLGHQNRSLGQSRRTRTVSLLCFLLLLCGAMPLSMAQEAAPEPEATIAVGNDTNADNDIRQRISNIYAEIGALADVQVNVKEGVVTLSGETVNDAQADTALSLAKRIEGVVTVNDGIERTLDLRGNVAPLIESTSKNITRSIRGLPLLLLAIGVFVLIVYVGNKLANWRSLWTRFVPNQFLAELVGSAVRIAAIIFAFVTSLNLLGASTLIGTILGGAGVAGIAIGFAVRDTLENYISSIMLSLRQPFRANDHVIIDDYEGIVVRLTSRATVLMTLEGNQLRIPNSNVFKAVILNYTRNPQRRFDFVLGVDAADDPIEAIQASIDAVSALPFILADPKPSAIIESVGDSNILIKVMAWVDQTETDFSKGRSMAIREAKDTLEAKGFTLPEPIYRLRFDTPAGGVFANEAIKATLQPQTPAAEVDSETAIEQQAASQQSNASTERERLSTSEQAATQGSASKQSSAAGSAASKKPTRAAKAVEIDVSPDHHVEEIAEAERQVQQEANLLDEDRPVE